MLIWHQGALGDLLLAAPALLALRRHYPRARITALGHPERWGLLSSTLALAAVWDSSAAAWTPLFSDSALPPRLAAALTPFQLALFFSPRPQAKLLQRLAEAGVPRVCWVPSFPGDGQAAVGVLQAGQLGTLGLTYEPGPWRLAGEGRGEDAPELPGPGPWLAVAPGSGHPKKNWPLAHYYEAARALAWEHQLSVVWLAGPAEAALLPYLKGLAAAQDHLVLAGEPLSWVAAVLRGCRLYLGNDSGLTHLAAAAGAPVLALYGPTDPRVWAPAGYSVRWLTGECDSAPCARGREISCPEPRCLTELSPAAVAAAAALLLAE